jgi:hypothetical protein
VGFEPTIPVLERAKTVRALDRAAVGIRHADHVAHSIRKQLALTSLTSGGRSVGMVRLRTEVMEFSPSLVLGFRTRNFPPPLNSFGPLRILS